MMMRTKIISMMMMAMMMLVACSEEESDEFCENPEAVCPDDSAIDASACCTSSSCYWTYNSKDYPCDGSDCESVMNTIIADACVNNKSLKSWDGDLEVLKAELNAVTEKLLAEARNSCADCN